MPLFVFSLASMALWVFCLVDVVTRDVRYIQHLPKTLWMVVILFVPVFGSVLWLVAGRGQRASPVYASVAAHVDAEGGERSQRMIPQPRKPFGRSAVNVLNNNAAPAGNNAQKVIRAKPEVHSAVVLISSKCQFDANAFELRRGILGCRAGDIRRPERRLLPAYLPVFTGGARS